MERCTTALLQCHHRDFPLMASGYSRFTLGHLRETQPSEPQSLDLRSCCDTAVIAADFRWKMCIGWHLLLYGHGESHLQWVAWVPAVGKCSAVGVLQSGGAFHCSTVTVLSSCGLSTGRDSLDFSDKNSSIKVGLS